MNKKGIMWSDVKNLLIALAIIALVLWMLGSKVGSGVAKQNECLGNQGICIETPCTGDLTPMTMFTCDKKEQYCCFDEARARTGEMTGICKNIPEDPATALSEEQINTYTIQCKQEIAGKTVKVASTCVFTGAALEENCQYDDYDADFEAYTRILPLYVNQNNVEPEE